MGKLAEDVAVSHPSEPSDKRQPGRPPHESIAELETLLVKTAAEEFLAHGYRGASLSRIVKQARISKTTLYSRYPSKEALFRAVIEHLPKVARPRDALPPASPSIDLEKSLEDYAYRMIAAALQEPLLSVNRLVLSESPRFPHLAQMASENTERGIDRIANFIAACRHQRNIESEHVRGMAKGFIHMLRGWYFDQIMTGRVVPEEERRLWAQQASRALTRSASDR